MQQNEQKANRLKWDTNINKFISGMDWPLLQTQKTALVKLVMETPDGETREALDGLLNFLDLFMDAVVADNIFSEKTVFGDLLADDDTQQVSTDFTHPELASDFGSGQFLPDEVFIIGIEQTSTSPENFELDIYEDGNGTHYRYNYDTRLEAETDMDIFKQKMGI